MIHSSFCMSWWLPLCGLERREKQRTRRGGGDAEATRWRINRGIRHRNRVYASRWRHSPCTRGWCWRESRPRRQAGRGGRSGLTVRPQIGAQRHYRPPRRARFIHKYRRIAISQRCHHFTVETPPPAPASLLHHLPMLPRATWQPPPFPPSALTVNMAIRWSNANTQIARGLTRIMGDQINCNDKK